MGIPKVEFGADPGSVEWTESRVGVDVVKGSMANAEKVLLLGDNLPPPPYPGGR